MNEYALRELGTIITGNTPSKKQSEFYDSDDIPFIKPDDFSFRDTINKFYENKNFISVKAKSNARIVEKNSVLVTCIGIIGKVLLTDKEVAFNQQINAIIPNEKVLSKYLAYNLLYNQYRLQFIANAPVVPIINKTQFSDFKIKIHSNILEQKQIVNKLEKIEVLIRNRNKQLSELDNLVKSRFNEMFIVNEFPTFPIGDLVDDVKYGTSKPSIKNGEYKYLRMNNITNSGELDLSDLKFINVDKNELEKCIVRRGDVLFNRTNSIDLVGKTCLFNNDEEMVIAGYIIRVRTKKEKLNPQYLTIFMNLKSTRKLLKLIAKGAVNQANINSKELQKIKVPLPPLSLQNQFADFVAQIDKSKFIGLNALELIENLLKIQYNSTVIN